MNLDLPIPRHLPAALTLPTVLAVGLAACGGPSSSVTEPVTPPDSFSVSGDSVLPDRWWTVLDEPGLDSTVERALVDNFDLRGAWQRLRASTAVAERTGALRWPAVDASASARASRGDGTDVARDDGSTFSVDLAASYEIDLWGRVDARVDADALRARATLADYRSAAISLSAEVVRAWAALAEAQSQVELVEGQIETNETVLQLLENRFGLGQVRAVDLLRQRQLVEATRQQRTSALEREEILEHRLAVLLGRTPQEGPGVDPGALPELPPLPDAGVPLELVRRRPDVRGAFLRLRAADRDVAAAVSEQYPRLSLSASTATEAGSVDGLFERWFSTIAGNLLAPIFYGGELRAEVNRAEAVREQRLVEYGQTTLIAFREVEDALVREARQRERIAQVETQLDVAEQASEQLRVEYFNGAADYLDVLTALDEVQRLRRDLLAVRLQLVETRIALYRALAGSFDTPREVQ